MTSMLMLLLAFTLLSLSSGFLSEPRFHPSNTIARPSTSLLFANNKKKKKTTATSFDLKELKQRINELNNPYHELLFQVDDDCQELPEQVHVIFFHPDTDQQGLHSVEYPKGSGSNFVLAFESPDACHKFAATLEAQSSNYFGHASLQCYDLDALEQLTESLGVFVQVVPEGKEILPPTQNVESVGKHNPNLKEQKSHLDYIYHMFELEGADELGLFEESSSLEAGCWE